MKSNFALGTEIFNFFFLYKKIIIKINKYNLKNFSNFDFPILILIYLLNFLPLIILYFLDMYIIRFRLLEDLEIDSNIFILFVIDILKFKI